MRVDFVQGEDLKVGRINLNHWRENGKADSFVYDFKKYHKKIDRHTTATLLKLR